MDYDTDMDIFLVGAALLNRGLNFGKQTPERSTGNAFAFTIVCPLNLGKRLSLKVVSKLNSKNVCWAACSCGAIQMGLT